MPLLRINATSAGLRLHESAGSVRDALHANSSTPGPAIIMLHGYKYAPNSTDHCPHIKLFGTEAHKWPAQLGFAGQRSDEGLGIALGWYARGPLRAVHARAADLGESLATVVALLRTQAPDRPVHVIAHSMGSELALNSLGHLPRGALDRMVLLTGASFSSRARDMLATSAGQGVDVLNVTSRENDLFDAAFERIIGPPLPGDRAIGQGIDGRRVANLQLDCPETLSTLRRFGFDVGAADRRICHWSSYRRTGIMALYRAFLRDRSGLSVERLLRALPDVPDPRWSRILTLPRITLPRPPIRLGFAPDPSGTLVERRPENEPAC